MKNIIITKHAKNIIPVSRLRRVKAEKIEKNIVFLLELFLRNLTPKLHIRTAKRDKKIWKFRNRFEYTNIGDVKKTKHPTFWNKFSLFPESLNKVYKNRNIKNP